jgi:ribonuclease D
MYTETIAAQEIEKLEYASFPGEIHVIESVGAEFNRAISYLRSQKVIGFDTETRPCFTQNQPRYGVALLQLSGPEKAFLFRLNKLGMHRRLCNVLANDKIIKVGAAVHDDIRGLQKLSEFKPSSFVDLQKIVWEWGIRDKSVKKMAAIIMGCRISKTQQLSNWEADTLSESQAKYAATDAWICREMYLKLMNSEKNPLIEDETVMGVKK